VPVKGLAEPTIQPTSTSAPIATNDDVEAAERRRQPAGIFAHQPVAGKTRSDAAADQRNQQHDDGDADTDAGVGDAVKMRFEMERDIAREHQQHQHHDIEISPVAAGQNLAGGCRGDQQQKACIDQHRHQPTGLGGKRHGKPPGDPDVDQHQQRRVLQRQPSGPVRDRREQKSRDHRRQIAVEHFMHMPVARRERRRQRDLAIERRQPDQNGERGIEGTKQEERAKAVGEKRPALVRAKAGNCHL